MFQPIQMLLDMVGVTETRLPTQGDRHRHQRPSLSEPEKVDGGIMSPWRAKQDKRECQARDALHQVFVDERSETEIMRQTLSATTDRFEVQNDRVIDQDQIEERTKDELRRTELMRFVKASDSLESLMEYFDRKIQLCNEIKDTKIREMTKAEVYEDFQGILAERHVHLYGRQKAQICREDL